MINQATAALAKYIKPIVIAAFVSAAAFGIAQRWQFIGSISDGHHQWLTGHSVQVVENWEQDGFWNDRGLFVERPASIEFNGILERRVYVSYPPGAQLELFVTKWLFPDSSTIALSHYIGIANQILIALLCYLIVASLTLHVGEPARSIFSIVPAIFYLLLPSPYYWHGMVFFADQAVILPFAAAIYLEALVRTRPRSWLYWVQSAVLFTMACIDWLVVPFTIVLFAFRLLSPGTGNFTSRSAFANALQVVAGPAIAIAGHLLIVIQIGGLWILEAKFLFRTGVSASGAAYVTNFLHQFFVLNLGTVNSILIVATGAFFVVRFARNRNDHIAAVALIGIVACTLQVFMLRSHSVIHDFSALKFILPLCYATFGLLPIVILELLPQRMGALNRLRLKPVAAVLIGLSVASYFLTQRAEWRTWFPPKGLAYGDIARWLRTNAHFNDVFVSSDIEIQTYPPQALAVARKVVWKFDTAAQLQSFLGRLPPQAVVHLIRDTTKSACDESKLGERIATVGKYSIVRSQPSMQALTGCMYSVGGAK